MISVSFELVYLYDNFLSKIGLFEGIYFSII